jgi:hypothetical protein
MNEPIKRGRGRPKKIPENSFYKNSLPSKWQASYLEAKKYTFDSIIEDAFYLAHGRIQYLLENYGKFNKEAQNIIDVAEALADPTNEDIPDNQRVSPEFIHELKLLLLNLSPDTLVRHLNSTIALADGAQRLALNDSGSIVRQLDICKVLLINILKYSEDTPTKELVLSAITQLKLEAGLPLEELQSLIKEVKGEKEKTEDNTQEENQTSQETQELLKDDDTENDLWNNENE